MFLIIIISFKSLRKGTVWRRVLDGFLASWVVMGTMSEALVRPPRWCDP